MSTTDTAGYPSFCPFYATRYRLTLFPPSPETLPATRHCTCLPSTSETSLGREPRRHIRRWTPCQEGAVSSPVVIDFSTQHSAISLLYVQFNRNQTIFVVNGHSWTYESHGSDNHTYNGCYFRTMFLDGCTD